MSGVHFHYCPLPLSHSGSKPPAYVPVVSTWSSSPEICFDGLALDGDDGGGSDDEDNLAYTQIVVSLDKEQQK